MHYLTLFILLASVACGSAEQQKEKTEAVKKKTPAVKAKINEKAIAAKAFINAPYATPSPSPTAEVSDAPLIVIGGENSPSTPAPVGMLYVAAPANWADAFTKAPKGKRLATREEVFELWDAGALKGVQFTTGVIWTASAKSSTEVWAMSTFDGSLASSALGNKLSAIYVDKE